jgi:hypothetical protein
MYITFYLIIIFQMSKQNQINYASSEISIPIILFSFLWKIISFRFIFPFALLLSLIVKYTVGYFSGYYFDKNNVDAIKREFIVSSSCLLVIKSCFNEDIINDSILTRILFIIFLNVPQYLFFHSEFEKSRNKILSINIETNDIAKGLCCIFFVSLLSIIFPLLWFLPILFSFARIIFDWNYYSSFFNKDISKCIFMSTNTMNLQFFMNFCLVFLSPYIYYELGIITLYNITCFLELIFSEPQKKIDMINQDSTTQFVQLMKIILISAGINNYWFLDAIFIFNSQYAFMKYIFLQN